MNKLCQKEIDELVLKLLEEIKEESTHVINW